MSITRRLIFTTVGPGGLIGFRHHQLDEGESQEVGPLEPNTLLCSLTQGAVETRYYAWKWKCSAQPGKPTEESFMLIPESAWHAYPMQ